jgi:sugar phosphate permease
MTPFGIISLEVSLCINFLMVGGPRFLGIRWAEQEKEPAEETAKKEKAKKEAAAETKAEDKKDRIILLHI